MARDNEFHTVETLLLLAQRLREKADSLQQAAEGFRAKSGGKRVMVSLGHNRGIETGIMRIEKMIDDLNKKVERGQYDPIPEFVFNPPQVESTLLPKLPPKIKNTAETDNRKSSKRPRGRSGNHK